jgi:hypothetical protein
MRPVNAARPRASAYQDGHRGESDPLKLLTDLREDVDAALTPSP